MSVNWTRDAAAHLSRRAGFGGTPAEIDSLYARGLEGAVSYLVDYDAVSLDAYESSLAARGYNLQRLSGLQQWFLDRMAFSPRPLEEKMTYFWNLHWTSGIAKVRGETLLLNQNKTERQYAMARFDDLVVKISQDPAMLVWLDNATNRVGRPNENYARELMELFCLGIGDYTEEDVRELARALTGWTVANYNRDTEYNAATFVDRPQFHDNGSKTILGQTGNFDGYDAIDIILNLTDSAGSVSGRFLGSKLWPFSPEPTRPSPSSTPSSRSMPPPDIRSARSSGRSSWTPSSTRPTRSRHGFAAPSSTPWPRSGCWSRRATSRPRPTHCRGWDRSCSTRPTPRDGTGALPG